MAIPTDKGIAGVYYEGTNIPFADISKTYKEIIQRTISGRLVDSTLTKLGQRAFENCSGLTSILLSGITDSYGATCFYLCTGLVTAVFTNTVGTGAQFLSTCSNLEAVDLSSTSVNGGTFNNCGKLVTIVLRKSSSIASLQNINAFNGSRFASGGAGGTIYIPKVLYDHLGDGTSDDYKAATNWSTIDSYGTITWAKIEGSQYENYYVDGTPIPS